MYTKALVKRVVKQTCLDHDRDFENVWTREMKWQVFINVCDNLFYGGKITEKQHTSWTSPF